MMHARHDCRCGSISLSCVEAPMTAPYLTNEPSRAEVNASAGALLLEFGSNGCGYCRRAQPLIVAALADRAALPHVKIQDGPGKPLGRSFGVKLWPTLVFLRDGKEIARVVRPTDAAVVAEALARLDVA